MQEPIWSYRRRIGTDDALSPRDEAETARVERLLDPAVAQDYLQARELMRCLLADTLNLDADGVQLQSHDDARPYAKGFEKTGISWSRSGPHAFAALMLDGRIGVDLEQIGPRDTDAMLRMIATEAERHVLSTLEGEDGQLMAFYRIWCSKEAVLKWRGDGLRGGAKSVDVPPAVIAGETDRAELDGLQLQLLQPAEDCLAAIAFSD